MNDNDDPFAEVKSATADYRTARQSLDYHRGLARHGMSNNLAFAVAAEHSAWHRMLRASAAFEAAQPVPPPKPTATVAPKPTTAPVTPKPVAPVAANPTASTTAESATVAGIRLRAEHAALSAAMTRNAQAQHEARERLYREERAKAEARIKGLR